MFGESIKVTRVTSAGRDDHGNAIPGASVTIELPGFAIASSSSSDAVSDVGTRVITGYTLYRRRPADIVTTDTIEIRGVPGWKVDGEVFAWVNPNNRRHRGVQFSVKRGI